MEKDKDGFYYIDCGGFGHNERIRSEPKDAEEVTLKGEITQEVAHPPKKSYPGSDGARIPISLDSHHPERSELQYRMVIPRMENKPMIKELTPEGVKLKGYDRVRQSPEEAQRQLKAGLSGHGLPRTIGQTIGGKTETDLYLDHFLGKHRRSPYLYTDMGQRPKLAPEDSQLSHVGRGLLGINDTSGLEDQMIMYCGAIDHGSFDHKLSRSSTDRAKVLSLIKSARGNVIKYIGRSPRGVVFMTTYKNTTIAELIRDPLRAYILLGRKVSSNYRLDDLAKKDLGTEKIIP